MHNKPQKAVVILLDSLNRHMLGAYGGQEFATPNLDRLASRSVRFTNHYTGSLPCIPARHDILVGAMDFLWRPWGSIELWERPITHGLRLKGIPTQLCTDHPHLFEVGGENYHTDFFAWDYTRGHESDPWKTRADPSWLGSPALPAGTRASQLPAQLQGKVPAMHYDLSRTWLKTEEEFPGPKTMRSAANWLEQNGRHHDQFLLFVDEFDPHEPFDTPRPWANMYDPDWQDELIIWPPYAIGGIEKGIIDARSGRHIRANYGSKLSMIDHWFGKVLDAMDENNLWDDTLFILCTDHGHYLGERDLWGKPAVMQYEALGHTPLMVACPGVAAGVEPALTTNVDIHATLVDLFDVDVPYLSHGKSMLPLLDGSSSSIRDWAVGGVYGRWVQITDGRHKYARSPVGSGFPLSMWSNRWSTMPIESMPGVRLPDPDRRAYLDTMPGTDIPVIRQPFAEGDLLPYWSINPPCDEHYLYDVVEDPTESVNRVGDAAESRMQDLLRQALVELQAPQEVLIRLDL